MNIHPKVEVWLFLRLQEKVASFKNWFNVYLQLNKYNFSNDLDKHDIVFPQFSGLSDQLINVTLAKKNQENPQIEENENLKKKSLNPSSWLQIVTRIFITVHFQNEIWNDIKKTLISKSDSRPCGPLSFPSCE